MFINILPPHNTIIADIFGKLAGVQEGLQTLKYSTDDLHEMLDSVN